MQIYCNCILKSRIMQSDQTEMTIELSSDKNSVKIMNKFSKLEGINNIAMMSYDGEYAV